MNDVKNLQSIARDLRIEIIEMLTIAGNGHPGGSLSAIDILTALFFKVLRHDPKKPDWRERDRFVLSKGHGVPALYACLAKSSYFALSELKTLRRLGSPLQGHPDRVRLPGIEASTGSLGQGLSIAQGMAMAHRLDKIDAFAYCVLGDGEIQEGQVWEAALSIPMHKLDRLVAFVDWNKCQIDGFTKDVMNIEPVADKFRAFGWNVLEINGNDMSEILKALDEAKVNAKNKTGKPTMVVADTIKGKGVSFMEKAGVSWHGVSTNREQADAAIAELKALNF